MVELVELVELAVMALMTLMAQAGTPVKATRPQTTRAAP